MHLDVVDLRTFYYGSGLGRLVQRSLRDRLRQIWPDVKGMTVVGFGFAAPFLRPFMGEAERTLCLMPAQQGVCPWPQEGPNVATLVEETLWPLPKGFADRILVAHGLETCERPHALLEEIHRVLAPGGRVVFITPNRAGLWARRDRTPFGYGRPYSAGQLEATLASHDFTPERTEAALYMPPSHARFWLRTGPMIERFGQRLDARRLAGVVLVEATRLVFITPKSGLKEAARVPLRVLEGLRPAPAPKPATGRTSQRHSAEVLPFRS
ncbi:MAG: class I SAM-dependent methyltransferase [Pseudomonadota bacterium]